MEEPARDASLNDFAFRCFRDTADGDYINARSAYRASLVPQALWASEQAIEKYLKCILLLRRVKWQSRRHSVVEPLERLDKAMTLDLPAEVRAFIKYIDVYGQDRYFTYPYYSLGDEMFKLDHTVWSLRRYCLSYFQAGNAHLERDPEHYKNIEDSRARPPNQYRSPYPGLLEKVVSTSEHPARKALIWRNVYFGSKVRKETFYESTFTAANPPLNLYPELLEELKGVVYLPREVT